MKERLIKAEALKNYCRNKLAISVTRSGTLRKFAEQLTEDTCRDVDAQPTVEAIPVKWIKEQAEEYPGVHDRGADPLHETAAAQVDTAADNGMHADFTAS